MEAEQLTAVQIQQVILRSLRLQAADLRRQALSRRMAGPQYVRQRAALREEAARCSAVADLILHASPDTLSWALGRQAA